MNFRKNERGGGGTGKEPKIVHTAIFMLEML